MSNSLSKIYDDYDCYKWLCKRLSIKPKNIEDDFYKHFEKLMKKYKYRRTYDGIKKL